MSAPIILREQVVAAARAWKDVRWLHQGRTRNGIDCIGLLLAVADALRIDGFDDAAALAADYSRQPDGRRLRAELEARMERTAYPLPGDVLLMRFSLNPQHVAIVSEDGAVIHAYAQARRVVEHRLDEIWQERVVCAYRFRGVA